MLSTNTLYSTENKWKSKLQKLLGAEIFHPARTVLQALCDFGYSGENLHSDLVEVFSDTGTVFFKLKNLLCSQMPYELTGITYVRPLSLWCPECFLSALFTLSG